MNYEARKQLVIHWSEIFKYTHHLSWKENLMQLISLWSTAVLPSWAGRVVTPVSPGKGSSDVLDIDMSDGLMLLFDSLQKMSAWLLLELEEAFGAQSPSVCFFCMSLI